MNQINEPFKSYIKNEIQNNNLSSFNNFNDIVLLEEKYLLKEIELDNKSLRDNFFLLFISLLTNIVLIIIGKI